jgi:hypothetical protein
VTRIFDSRSTGFVPRVWVIVFVLAVVWLFVGAGRAMAEPSEHPLEVVPGSFNIVPSTYQAGAHANWTLTFDIAHNKKGKTYNDLRGTVVNYPTGFMGNNLAVPTCTLTQLLAQGPPEASGTLCPPGSQVGTISVEVTVNTEPVRLTAPVYNVETSSFGITAELGFKTEVLTQTLPVIVRPQDSGLTGTSPDVKELGESHEVVLTLWGIPASHEHDAERGLVCGEFAEPNKVECGGGGEEAKIPVEPYLANPTSCGTFQESMKADSWEEPQPAEWTEPFAEILAPRGAMAEVGPFVECERVHFDPSIKTEPTTNSAESASGLNVSLEVPQTWENPSTIATSNVKDVTVTLPAGYTVNPSEGNGLVGCTPQEYAAESAFSLPGEGCPPESKIGTVKIETPVLADKIEGSIYIATPYNNIPEFGTPEHPGGSLIALYVVAKDPNRGIIVKSAGKVTPNPVTGQLTSTFQNLPQQPFSKVIFKLTQSVTSPLVSPQACGTYVTQAELTPSSAPNEPHTVSNPLRIEKGIGDGPCPNGGTPPFKPTVIAGTTDNDAGNYSPFYLRITRQDGEQEITKFSTVMPPGLTGNLTGIPFCSEAQIEATRQATGLQEIENPSCPVASEIGHSLVGAGVGSVLAWTPGKVYLAGPYHGAPFSIVSVTSATVGPFDLGTVVIRFALQINPITAQPEIDSTGSDPIPHIIDGIVVHVREIHVYIERAKFILDPTSCEPISISDTITGAGADFTNPADQDPVTIATPFQAADCQNLQFKPTFAASASGKTSRKDGTSVTFKISYPSGALGHEAWFKSAKFDIPKQLPARLSTLQKSCPVATFAKNPSACPSASRIGTMTVNTQIVPVPLTGPVYFVSNGSLKFPEAVIVLQGYGITVDLHGETFINEKTSVTSATFRAIPGVPFNNVTVSLPAGPYSEFTANTNICKAKLNMPIALTAQNGQTIHRTTKITVTNCPKTHTKPKKKTTRKKRKNAK